MKKFTVNPRTGIIGLGNPKPARPPSSTRSLPARYPAKRMEVGVDMDGLVMVAKEIGKAIVKEMRKGIQVTGVVSETRRSPQGPVLSKEEAISATARIGIDESLIDVGIGETDELKKGDGSANLAKNNAQQDAGFTKSKNKLKRLKRG